MGSKVGNNNPRQSLESLTHAFREVLGPPAPAPAPAPGAVPGAKAKVNYFVGKKTKNKCEIDGVVRRDVTYLSEKSKKHGPANAAYRLSGRRKAQYKEASLYLFDLVRQAQDTRNGLDIDQIWAAQRIEFVLVQSRSKGYIKMDDIRGNLGKVLEGLEAKILKSAEAVQKDYGGVADKISHFLDDVEAVRSGNGRALVRENVRKQGDGNFQLLEQIGLVNEWAKTLQPQPLQTIQPLQGATVSQLTLRPRSFTAPGASTAGLTGKNLLDKLAKWPGHGLRQKAADLFEYAKPQYHPDRFKQACNEVLLELAEQEFILNSLSDEFLNTIESEEDREKLQALGESVKKLLWAFRNSDSPFTRLGDLARAGYNLPDATAQTLVAKRAEYFRSLVGSTPPTDVLPPPLVNVPPAAGNGQPAANPQPLVSNGQPAANPQPLVSNGQPAVNPQPPASKGHPAANPQSAGSNGQPAPANFQPLPANGQPAPAKAQPAPNGQASVQSSVAAGNSTSAGRPLPAEPGKVTPGSGKEQSAVGKAQPALASSQPALGNPPPDAAVLQSPGGSVQPPSNLAQPAASTALPDLANLPAIPNVLPPPSNVGQASQPASNLVAATPPATNNVTPPPSGLPPGNASLSLKKPAGTLVAKRLAELGDTGGPISPVNSSPVAGSVKPLSNLAQPAASVAPSGVANLQIPDGLPSSLPSLGSQLPPANGGDESAPPDVPEPFIVPSVSMPAPTSVAVANAELSPGVVTPGEGPDVASLPTVEPTVSSVTPPISGQPPGELHQPVVVETSTQAAPSSLPPSPLDDPLPPPPLDDPLPPPPGDVPPLGVMQVIPEMNHKPRVLYASQKPSQTGAEVANKKDLDNRIGSFGAKVASKVTAAAKKIEKQFKEIGGGEAEKTRSKEFDQRLIDNATRDARMVLAFSDFAGNSKESRLLVSERQERIGKLHEQALGAAMPSPQRAVAEYFAADGGKSEGGAAQNYFRRMTNQVQSYMKGTSPKLPETAANLSVANLENNKLINKITFVGQSAGVVDLAVTSAFPDFHRETKEFIRQHPVLGGFMPKGFIPSEVFSFTAGGLLLRSTLLIENIFDRIGNAKLFKIGADEIVDTMERNFTLLRFLALLLTDEEYVQKFPDNVRSSVREFGKLVQEFAEDILDPSRPFRAAYQLARVAQIAPLETMLKLNEGRIPPPPADLPPPAPSDPAPPGGWIGGPPPDMLMPPPVLPDVSTTVN